MTTPPPPPPPYGATAPPGGAPPPNNLVWGILTTVLCCLPLGIVSIVKAAQVNALWAQGQYESARKAADDAKKFAIWAAVAGAIVIVLYLIFLISLGAAGTYGATSAYWATSAY